jgi:hypothetical protein
MSRIPRNNNHSFDHVQHWEGDVVTQNASGESIHVEKGRS